MQNFIKIIIITLCAVLICGALFILEPDKSPKGHFDGQTSVCFGNNCFFVEIAKTQVEMEKGLMDRRFLAENQGMLFIFEKAGNYSFWMKNTLIPLDIIWLDENGKIVSMAENAKPCLPTGTGEKFQCPQIAGDGLAKYVLELNAGLVQKLNVKVGRKVILNYPQ